jgi:hypothetical protein
MRLALERTRSLAEAFALSGGRGMTLAAQFGDYGIRGGDIRIAGRISSTSQ